jgi:hypothetical protein
MKVPEIHIESDFDFDKFLNFSTAKKNKFICTIDIFGKKTISFKDYKSYKKFKEIYDNYIASDRFIKDLKSGRYDNILDKPFNSKKK